MRVAIREGHYAHAVSLNKYIGRDQGVDSVNLHLGIFTALD